MINILKLLLIFILVSCAHNKPSYHPKPLSKGKSRIIVYWPRQWQSQWATFRLYANNEKLKILKNEHFYVIDHEPGMIEVKSHHTQDSNFIVLMTILTKADQVYFLKLDTQPKEVTLMSAYDDIMAVGSIVSGMKSEMRLKEGRGSWKDAKNLIDKEKAKAVMESRREALGYHVLLPMEEQVAVEEIKKCCRE
jgi:hypothetical protein